MKIIIVGATGFIGSEVLAHCRSKPSITSIVVISRRQPSQDILADPKVISLVTQDFVTLSEEAKSQLKDASAAIWALRASTPEVELDFPLAFAKSISSMRLRATSPFRYMHVSGILAEKDQEKPLWFLQEGRRVKGLAETRLRDLSTKGDTVNKWETYIARPSMVLPNPPGMLNSWAGWMLGAIGVDELADAMIDIVETGASTDTFENADLVKYARGLRADQIRSSIGSMSDDA